MPPLKRKTAPPSAPPKKKATPSSRPPSSSSPFDPVPLSTSSASLPPASVNPARVRTLSEGTEKVPGNVAYWMSRDQRVSDNWALLHAAYEAKKRGRGVAVVFSLVDSFLGAKARHFGFMLRGLEKVSEILEREGVPFYLCRGSPEDTIPSFVKKYNVSLLVTDYSPLRIGRIWRERICENIRSVVGNGVTVEEVDAHSTVPLWAASEKLEYSARTIRGKIHSKLGEFLVEYPKLDAGVNPWDGDKPANVNWKHLIEEVTTVGSEVPEVDWIVPGEEAALDALIGANSGFLTRRFQKYSELRNDPSKVGVLSGLSPWLHYGHLSQQRCALEARKRRKENPKSADAFLEELVVRSSLADNFCHYAANGKYDSLEGAWAWARETLSLHAKDKRENVYTLEQLEKGKTHDELWNAAQKEMVYLGKMHGFMRMYWAKKILEWTNSPEEALEFAIFLNDKYELDGRDPNGYVGCMWSICGVHDQGWGERPIFGKIRYMNYAGCKKKFNVDEYVALVNRLVNDIKNKNKKGSKTPSKARDIASMLAATGLKKDKKKE